MRGTASLRQPILPGPAGTGCGRPIGIDQWCAYHQIPLVWREPESQRRPGKAGRVRTGLP